MPVAVCEACNQYATTKQSTLCANCALLKPEQLAAVKKAAAIRREMELKNVDQTGLIAELQQQIAQLQADNATLQEENATLQEALADLGMSASAKKK